MFQSGKRLSLTLSFFTDLILTRYKDDLYYRVISMLLETDIQKGIANLKLQIIFALRKWFETRSNTPWLKKILWVIGVLRKTVVSDWRFDNLCRSHLQSQVVVLVSWKFKNPGEQFDWSVDRVAVGQCVMWLAVKTYVEIGYANKLTAIRAIERNGWKGSVTHGLGASRTPGLPRKVR